VRVLLELFHWKGSLLRASPSGAELATENK